MLNSFKLLTKTTTRTLFKPSLTSTFIRMASSTRIQVGSIDLLQDGKMLVYFSTSLHLTVIDTSIQNYRKEIPFPNEVRDPH